MTLFRRFRSGPPPTDRPRTAAPPQRDADAPGARVVPERVVPERVVTVRLVAPPPATWRGAGVLALGLILGALAAAGFLAGERPRLVLSPPPPGPASVGDIDAAVRRLLRADASSDHRLAGASSGTWRGAESPAAEAVAAPTASPPPGRPAVAWRRDPISGASR